MFRMEEINGEQVLLWSKEAETKGENKHFKVHRVNVRRKGGHVERNSQFLTLLVRFYRLCHVVVLLLFLLLMLGWVEKLYPIITNSRFI